jgi:membrane protein
MTTNPILLFIMNVIDLRLILLLLLQICLFTAMYTVLPNEHNDVMKSLPGALLSSVGWMLFSQLFSVYVEHFHHYAHIFGSVYAVALALLWLYCCIYIVFLGGALNRYLTERK